MTTKRRMFNLLYIRAAIEQKTGIKLRLKQVADYLVELGLITKSEAITAIFYGYDSYDRTTNHTKPLANPQPVDLELNKFDKSFEDADEEEEP